MQDFLLNIDNKEILIEILHHSIDYLIGNRNDQHTFRLCHKYGFQSPDDFMTTTRMISRCYQNCCTERGSEAELLSEFANLKPDLQRLVPIILAARRPEVMSYLLRRHNAQEHPLVESFDWSLLFVMGDSSYAQNRRKLVTVTFNCRNSSDKTYSMHFQMDRRRLEEFIATCEAALKQITHNEDDNDDSDDTKKIATIEN